MADVAWQGESSVLNEDTLGNDRMRPVQNYPPRDPNHVTASWFDHPRDLLHLVNVKRAEMPRPIVGVGHSMGGAHLSVPGCNHTLSAV